MASSSFAESDEAIRMHSASAKAFVAMRHMLISEADAVKSDSRAGSGLFGTISRAAAVTVTAGRIGIRCNSRAA
jgi:hypothetical protein